MQDERAHGRWMAGIEHRLTSLETFRDTILHYARRYGLIAALGAAGYVGHMDTLELASKLQWAARLIGTGGH
jgi:hypothetical protein